MTSKSDSCLRLARILPLAALFAACASFPVSAQSRSVPAAGDLSPRLAELSRPAVRGLPAARQAERLGVPPSGPGSLLRDQGRVLVDVRFEEGAIAALDDLRAAGAEVLAASRRYQTATVSIAPGHLRELAAVLGVVGVTENRAPLVLTDSSQAAAIGAECEGGSVVSEGVAQLHADAARSKYGVDGSGVTVGVLSDSYDQAGGAVTDAGADVASGDLPGPVHPCPSSTAPVEVLQDFSSPAASDEGRAMLQIVHDVAPGAGLAFATAFLSELSFAQNIEELAEPVSAGGAEADVIVDDVVWFEEPFFQDGPVAVAVDNVAADGVAYFSSAGNNNLFEGPTNEIASWEAPAFRNSGACPAAVLAELPVGTDRCMDFDPNGAVTDDTFAITVSPGATLTLDLQWAEPWLGVETDLDAYLLDAGGNLIAAEESNNVHASRQRPVEILQWENDSGASRTVHLAINRCAAACNPAASGSATPTLKFALLQNGGGVTMSEYPTSLEGDTVGPTVFGHAAASGAAAVAAIHYAASSQPEKFSSRGPVVHRFEPVEGTTAADPLPGPEVIAKPDITATDCGETTFFAFFVGGEGAWRFCGTSAAAPHAAAVAALELEAKPGATVQELRDAQTATADPIGAFGPNAVGAGLLNADEAIASLLPPATVAITAHPTSRTADSTPTFEFQSSPASVAFECSVDGGPPVPCTSPYTVSSPLPDGPHQFEVEGVEVSGSASFSFTVDTAPPAIEVTGRPAEISADASPAISFSADEPADFTCVLDGKATPHCDSPFAPGSLSDGPHTVELTATDQVGNSAAVVIGFSVDTAAPALALTAQPPPKSTDRLPAFAFAADEPATYACAIDGAPAQPCASPYRSPNPLADGEHGFRVLATDQAGNVAAATASFTVDTRPPETAFRSRLRALVRTRKAFARVTVRFSGDEPGAIFLCRVDRRPLRSCGPSLSRRFALGRHAIRVQAADELGNLDPTPAIYRFRVERPPLSGRG